MITSSGMRQERERKEKERGGEKKERRGERKEEKRGKGEEDVLQDQAPAADPGDQLAHRGVGVRVG
ncbi:hypothetical protein, partial [Streptomyces sp. CRB46]|uniref:hypothetical protein n=1 Tax=Streptomyces sp. CRB46 TaxID=2682613 RepID=UPI001F385539